MVEYSGAPANRLLLVTAYTLTLPALTCGSEMNGVPNPAFVSPLTNCGYRRPATLVIHVNDVDARQLPE